MEKKAKHRGNRKDRENRETDGLGRADADGVEREGYGGRREREEVREESGKHADGRVD